MDLHKREAFESVWKALGIRSGYDGQDRQRQMQGQKKMKVSKTKNGEESVWDMKRMNRRSRLWSG